MAKQTVLLLPFGGNNVQRLMHRVSIVKTRIIHSDVISTFLFVAANLAAMLYGKEM